ncbi:MAG TPA: DUF411 domain-containing protein [Pseudomonadales bacterium]
MHRLLLIGLLTAAAAAAAPAPGREAAAASEVEITVHKTPWCGCCGNWVEHLRDHGLSVKVVEHDDLTALRASLGVPPALASCHTAEAGSYRIEGHVPAREIRRLLLERPEGVRGLAVPGMPLGSPGMEAGGRRQPYDVIAFGENGERHVYQSYRD